MLGGTHLESELAPVGPTYINEPLRTEGIRQREEILRRVRDLVCKKTQGLFYFNFSFFNLFLLILMFLETWEAGYFFTIKSTKNY